MNIMNIYPIILFDIQIDRQIDRQIDIDIDQVLREYKNL